MRTVWSTKTSLLIALKGLSWNWGRGGAGPEYLQPGWAELRAAFLRAPGDPVGTTLRFGVSGSLRSNFPLDWIMSTRGAACKNEQIFPKDQIWTNTLYLSNGWIQHVGKWPCNQTRLPMWGQPRMEVIWDIEIEFMTLYHQPLLILWLGWG